jgi:CRP-like cAMP-binding protein
MSREIVRSLDGVPLLSPLTVGEREALARQSRFKRFALGEHIIDWQSDGRDVHIVTSGTVRVVNYSLSGREVTLDDVTAGGYFGELAAIDGGPRSAFVMARGEETVTAAVPCDVFLEVLAAHPSIAREIMRRLAKMVRQATDRIMDLSTLNANSRVLAELLRQAWSFTIDGQSATISPIPVHADIASRVSATRETVARALNKLAREGIVERRKKALVIHDMVKLARMIDEMRAIPD